MIARLFRFAFTPAGVFGQLHVGGFSCYTVEKPWNKNLPYVSCIPSGKYQIVPSVYNRGGYDAYEILDVHGRHQIKIHIGNRAKDVQGCIALGNQLGAVHGEWAVTNSSAAFGAFMNAMNGRSGEIQIINTTGVAL